MISNLSCWLVVSSCTQLLASHEVVKYLLTFLLIARSNLLLLLELLLVWRYEHRVPSLRIGACRYCHILSSQEGAKKKHLDLQEPAVPDRLTSAAAALLFALPQYHLPYDLSSLLSATRYEKSSMKFCKNLQRVVDISDPEWAPYWPNYKMLKKLIKGLPSLVPSDEHKATSEGKPVDSKGAKEATKEQQRGDHTTESSKLASAASGDPKVSDDASGQPQSPNSMTKSPGEVAFFKMLHAEFKKASHFFDRAVQEFAIREERVREGMEIMKQPNSIMVNEKWAVMAKGIYRLYKDLLLLETFAIMSYCSFSKILKKHDKVTGYKTRIAFMSNIVNKANFTNYPDVLEMIARCEVLYEDVSKNLLQEGKAGLYEDERLFINMIHRLNEQVLNSDQEDLNPERKKRPTIVPLATADKKESEATSSLRSLVEENEKNAVPQVSDGHGHEDDDESHEGAVDASKPSAKRSAETLSSSKEVKKQKKL
eukprot:Nitzschia sp. Nitz4//scaffold41_size133979//63125//64664//NITZ4_003349-RA/size133979-snap-gene-0.103-mRNA-1//1//CDS//3329551476//1934//frame0